MQAILPSQPSILAVHHHADVAEGCVCVLQVLLCCLSGSALAATQGPLPFKSGIGAATAGSSPPSPQLVLESADEGVDAQPTAAASDNAAARDNAAATTAATSQVQEGGRGVTVTSGGGWSSGNSSSSCGNRVATAS